MSTRLEDQNKFNKNPVQTSTHLRDTRAGYEAKGPVPWAALQAGYSYMVPCDAPESVPTVAEVAEQEEIVEEPVAPKKPKVAVKRKVKAKKRKVKAKKRKKITIKKAVAPESAPVSEEPVEAIA